MFKKKDNSPLTKDAALIRMQQYCEYQDRCHQEVRTKLIELKVYGADLEDVLTDLIQDDFLNEERFARSYARGKFRMKKWGKMKIQQELKFRKVSPYCIKKGMTEIDDDEYSEALLAVMTKYRRTHKFKNQWDLRQKMFNHAYSKGYESFLINEFMGEFTV